MATHSSVLAWRIPGTREPDGLPYMGLHRVGLKLLSSSSSSSSSSALAGGFLTTKTIREAPTLVLVLDYSEFMV